MSKEIIILGSTGSIGLSTLQSIKKNKNFKLLLISANKKGKILLKQATQYKVKNAIIEDETEFNRFKGVFKSKNINLYHGLKNINKILKKKVDYCVNSISGIEGLEPTLNIIPFCKNILIANKESIICGWDLISLKLKKFKTNFIPIDSEHFSIWELIKNEKLFNIRKIILTASGGPFLKINQKKISNIKPILALKHPNWKMGKKISIDSSTMMNKIFEFIEAKKIFNIEKEKIQILIHPTSFVHAIVFFKGNLIKFLAHETKMTIPISNALGIKSELKNNEIKKNIKDLNSLEFKYPDKKIFPVISILKMLPKNETYFETILVTINDTLVDKYLNSHINYASIQTNLLRFLKKPFFTKYYKLKPKNIYDINKMVSITKKYIEKKI